MDVLYVCLLPYILEVGNYVLIPALAGHKEELPKRRQTHTYTNAFFFFKMKA